MLPCIHSRRQQKGTRFRFQSFRPSVIETRGTTRYRCATVLHVLLSSDKASKQNASQGTRHATPGTIQALATCKWSTSLKCNGFDWRGASIYYLYEPVPGATIYMQVGDADDKTNAATSVTGQPINACMHILPLALQSCTYTDTLTFQGETQIAPKERTEAKTQRSRC